MAIIELQINTARFCEYVQGEINSRPLPADNVQTMVGISLLHPPPTPGYAVDRIHCTGCVVDFAASTGGALTITASIDVHYVAGFGAIYAVDSMQPPQTQTISFTAPLTISLSVSGPRPSLTWSAAPLPMSDTFPISLPTGVTAAAGAIVATPDLVVIRIGTQAGDPVMAAPIDRLNGRDWNQLIPGQVFADILIGSLNEQIQDAVSPDVEISKRARGSWDIMTRRALAWAELTALGQCAFGIEIPIDLTLTCQLQLNGTWLTTTIRLEWDADSTWCNILGGALFIPLGFVIDRKVDKEASSKILGLAQTPSDYEQVGQTEDSITWERIVQLASPSDRFQVGSSEVTPFGVELAGSLHPRPGLGGLSAEVTRPAWGFALSCSPEGAGVVWYPGRIVLHAINGAAPPRIFDALNVFSPADAWRVVYDSSAQSSNEVAITFSDPEHGRLASGTATKVVLFTDCGIRWIDLGTIPDDTLSTDQELVNSMKRLAHQKCRAISNPWGIEPDKATIFQWMVDPLLDPDPDRVKELGSLRLWTLGVRDIPESAHLEFFAVSSDGTERSLGTVVNATTAALQIVTGADELLAVRSSERFEPAGLSLRQTWLRPMSATPLTGVRPVAFRQESATIELASSGQAAPKEVVVSTAMHNFRAAANSLGDRANGQPAWAHALRLDRATMAFAFRDQVVVATTSPTIRIR